MGIQTNMSQSFTLKKTFTRAFFILIISLLISKPGFSEEIKVGKHEILELVFRAKGEQKNPFDVYLLKLEITDPNDRKFYMDGFFDGDGNGGRYGNIWKVRICPNKTGLWSWRTIEADANNRTFIGVEGRFRCEESGDKGGITAEKRHFRFQDGDFTYLQGNFLDFKEGMRSTHVYMSETTNNSQRKAILERQRDYHRVNKMNLYLANKGDYSGQSVTPWLGTAASNDKSEFDLKRWKNYDTYLQQLKEDGILAELWFFADDSNFGRLSQKDKNRLFRYAMARLSAFCHTLFVIALEWAEEWTADSISKSGAYIQAHNPWGRLLSVHNIESNRVLRFLHHRKHRKWSFSGENWANFIASQAGNHSSVEDVNVLARDLRQEEKIPHLSEEFGSLYKDTDDRLRAKLWANFCGGAAGGGTGSDIAVFMNFLERSKIPFQRMTAANSLVEDGGGRLQFCLAEKGHHYLIYSISGSFKISTINTRLRGYWLNPRNSSIIYEKEDFISEGEHVYTPPSNSERDWVLWLTDGSNLRTGSLYPSKGSKMLPILINKWGHEIVKN